MPKFIKANQLVEVNRHGVESNRMVLFTDDEMVERIRLNPSLVIEVTESHAAGVIRVQGKYQEVSEEVLAAVEDKIEAARPVIPSTPTPPTGDEPKAPAKSKKAPVVNDKNKSSLKFNGA